MPSVTKLSWEGGLSSPPFEVRWVFVEQGSRLPCGKRQQAAAVQGCSIVGWVTRRNDTQHRGRS